MTADPPSIKELPISINEKSYDLRIWDCGGEFRFRPFYEGYFKGADGVLLFFDVTRPQTFAELDFFLYFMNKIKPGLPIVLVATKSDLKDHRQISLEEAHKFQKSHKIENYIEISNKTGENVDKVLELLIPLL